MMTESARLPLRSTIRTARPRGFSCLSSMILSVIGAGSRAVRGSGTPGYKPASPPSRYACCHSPRLLLLTFSSRQTRAMPIPSSLCNRTALSFSATVKRREVFAPPAPLGGLFLFFSATTSSFMLPLHLSLECQPLSCLNQSHDLVVSTLTDSRCYVLRGHFLWSHHFNYGSQADSDYGHFPDR